MHGYDQVSMHYRMLNDQVRMNAFEQAIQDVVKLGDVVCDFGTGSGVLAMLACRAGARRVYAIDRSNFIKTAAKLCESNGFADRITFLKSDARSVNLPEPVDVLISEWLGNAALEENMLLPLIGLRDRVLKPQGTMLPGVVRIMAAPICASDRFAQINFFSKPVCGLSFKDLALPAAKERFWAHLSPSELMTEAQLVTELDMCSVSIRPLHETLTFEFSESGLCQGIAVWFEAEVAPGVLLPTGPKEPQTHWRQVMLPVGPDPIDVARGSRLNATISAQGAGEVTEWDWSTEFKTAAEVAFSN